METKTSHTPTPWEYRHGQIGKAMVVYSRPCFQPIVASIAPGADAAFIVRAVNAHEDLLKAAKAARELSPLTDKSQWANVLNQLEQAIAKAEDK